MLKIFNTSDANHQDRKVNKLIMLNPKNKTRGKKRKHAYVHVRKVKLCIGQSIGYIYCIEVDW
jgi:hypothetical protein